MWYSSDCWPVTAFVLDAMGRLKMCDWPLHQQQPADQAPRAFRLANYIEHGAGRVTSIMCACGIALRRRQLLPALINWRCKPFLSHMIIIASEIKCSHHAVWGLMHWLGKENKIMGRNWYCNLHAQHGRWATCVQSVAFVASCALSGKLRAMDEAAVPAAASDEAAVPAAAGNEVARG